jgi:hypothetical protein
MFLVIDYERDGMAENLAQDAHQATASLLKVRSWQ